ncbi:hypothetical protein UlMin_003930 [Ulmus minor]
MLAYGIAADATDEYIKIGESTAIQSLKKICRAVVEVFSEQYLRSPNANDVARLLHISKRRGFPGMLDSLDCMHWKWKNCPTAWAGQYAVHSGSPSIILEAVADYDLWIWHAYFGLPGSNNDINVLEASHLFANLTEGIAPSDERDVDAAIEDWMEAPTPEVEIAIQSIKRIVWSVCWFSEILKIKIKIKNKNKKFTKKNLKGTKKIS